MANVVPSFKGRKEKPVNYRHVSLTLVVDMLLEVILEDSIWRGKE